MTFEANHGATVIRVTLYGDVSEGREARERQIAMYRAQQLAPTTPRPVYGRQRDYLPEDR